MNALITSTINNIFHGIWFGCLVLEPKYSRKKTAMIVTATVVFFELIVIGMNYMRASGMLRLGENNVAISYMVAYLLATFIFGGMYVFVVSGFHPAKSLFLLSAYFSLWTFIYISISLITGTFSGAGTIAIWLLRIGLNLFFLLLYLLFFQRRLRRICREVKSGYGVVSALSAIAFTVMTLLIFYNEKTKSRDVFYMIVVFCICFFVAGIYVLLFRFIEQLAHVGAMKQMQFHEKFLMAQIDAYEKIAQSARQTRHDFRHHNMVVAEYARNKDYRGILSYLDEYEERESRKYAADFCKNHAVNNVLCAYADRAARNDISVTTDIRLLDTYRISDYDLVSILANVLENAVNGCMRTEGRRELEITLKQKGHKLILTCKNTSPPDVLFENGLPRNKEHDGVGVESILSCVEKYSGDADFSISGETFTCRVILNNI